MTPHSERYLLSFAPPPSKSLASVSDPWRAFWADRMPFKGPQPHLVRCLWNFRDTSRLLSGVFRYVRRSKDPFGNTNDAKLDHSFVKWSLNAKNFYSKIELVTKLALKTPGRPAGRPPPQGRQEVPNLRVLPWQGSSLQIVGAYRRLPAQPKTRPFPRPHRVPLLTKYDQ